MSKATFGMSFLAGAMFAVTIAHAQQTSGGVTNALQTPPQGPTAAQPQAVPGQQPLQQPAIETRQNFVPTDNRLDRRGNTFQSDPGRSIPAPFGNQSPGFNDDRSASGQPGQAGTTFNGQRVMAQRGELGVWLSVAGGPGVEIRSVTEGSPAARIGLEPGDVLLQVNGEPVVSPTEVQQLIRAIPAGEIAVLEVLRDGAAQEVSVALQPIREAYRSAYRGEAAGSPVEGDLEMRTMRLEEQLSTVMRDLQQLREQLTQLQRMHPESTSTHVGAERAATPPSPIDDIGAAPHKAPSGAQPVQSDPFAEEPATTGATAAERGSTATEPPVTAPPSTSEPAATEAAEPAQDLFGEETAEPKSATTPATEAEPETDGEIDSDSLFE